MTTEELEARLRSAEEQLAKLLQAGKSAERRPNEWSRVRDEFKARVTKNTGIPAKNSVCCVLGSVCHSRYSLHNVSRMTTAQADETMEWMDDFIKLCGLDGKQPSQHPHNADYTTKKD